MGANFGSNDDVISDINITPFVDIILVVLIIFMVTATRIVETSLMVNLPDAATGEQPESVSIGLTLTEDGKLLLDGEEVSTAQLESALATAREDSDDVVCLIAADEMVAHGRVVWLIDFVKSQGIAKFAINIDKAHSLPPDPALLDKGRGAVPISTASPASP